ncbi:hypothetical protein Tco_0134737 [Tanacetum coccineum]
MNYIPVRKENYADSGGNVSTHDDVEDLDDQQFIVHGPSIHAAQPMHSEERNPRKSLKLIRGNWVEANANGLAQFQATRSQGTTKAGVDYEENFATIARIEAIRLLFGIASSRALLSMQWMSKVHFYNGNILKNPVFTQRPSNSDSQHFLQDVMKTDNFSRDAQGTPTQSAAQASISTAEGTVDLQDTAEAQGTDDAQGTAAAQGATDTPKSPNDYTSPNMRLKHLRNEGLLDLYALYREVRRHRSKLCLKAKQISQSKQTQKTVKNVQPVFKHHAFCKSQNRKKRRKKQRKKQRKKVSSVKLGRNKVECNLSEENNDQDDHTASL